jgi:hypothetical protein
MAFGNKTYKLNLKNQNYKYDNYARNLVGRSFGKYKNGMHEAHGNSCFCQNKEEAAQTVKYHEPCDEIL